MGDKSFDDNVVPATQVPGGLSAVLSLALCEPHSEAFIPINPMRSTHLVLESSFHTGFRISDPVSDPCTI